MQGDIKDVRMQGANDIFRSIFWQQAVRFGPVANCDRTDDFAACAAERRFWWFMCLMCLHDSYIYHV